MPRHNGQHLEHVSEEIKTRTIAANRSYFGLHKHLEPQTVSMTTEVQIHKTVIRPIIMYGAECWMCSRGKYCEGSAANAGRWRWGSRYNFELYIHCVSGPG